MVGDQLEHVYIGMDDFEETVEEFKSKAREVAREPFTVPSVGTRKFAFI